MKVTIHLHVMPFTHWSQFRVHHTKNYNYMYWKNKMWNNNVEHMQKKSYVILFLGYNFGRLTYQSLHAQNTKLGLELLKSVKLGIYSYPGLQCHWFCTRPRVILRCPLTTQPQTKIINKVNTQKGSDSDQYIRRHNIVLTILKF